MIRRWAFRCDLLCDDILYLYSIAILIQTQPKMQKILWGLQTFHFATLDVYDVQRNRAASPRHRSKRIYSCWFEPQPLDVTACELCSFSCYHTHTSPSYCMQTLKVQKSEPGVWPNDLNMIKMWNVTKQYSPRGEEIRMSASYPIFQTVWSMLVRHMQYCTFAMWMALQSHQPLYCICNIFSFNAGRLVSSDRWPSVMCKSMFSLRSRWYVFSPRSWKKIIL